MTLPAEQFNPGGFPICFFPGTSQPVPFILTEDEAIRFLRLDQANLKDPASTLQYYRKRGLLLPIQLGRNLRYPLDELLRFLKRIREVNPR